MIFIMKDGSKKLIRGSLSESNGYYVIDDGENVQSLPIDSVERIYALNEWEESVVSGGEIEKP